MDPRKPLPFTEEFVRQLCQEFPTPFYVYDEKTIRSNCKKLNSAFSALPGYCNYFAIKATPNPYILTILKEENLKMDCSSLGELILAEACDMRGDQLLLTSNNTPLKLFAKAKELDAIINLDDISLLPFLEEKIGLPECICFRYNPGQTRLGGNDVIGQPEESKYGLTKVQLLDAYRMAKERGVKRFGLHTMIISNTLLHEEFTETAKIMFSLAVEISEKLDIQLDFVNLGGGLGIPYKPEDSQINLEKLGTDIGKLYQDIVMKNKQLANMKVFTENGRIVTASAGFLVTRIINQKHIYKNYLGVDACMANLMRPALYGAYHHITVIKDPNVPNSLPSNRNIFKGTSYKNDKPEDVYDVVGALCENNDKFAINRKLGEVNIGDIVVIHDTGAHGHSMGFNYNSQLRSAEFLLHEHGNVTQIRRAETLSDLFGTLDFPGLNTITRSSICK